MTVSSYRLDTVAASLVSRMEAARPFYAHRPDALEPAFTDIATEEIDRVIAEHDEIMGEPGYGARLRRELLQTFLPRYLVLARDHNALEEAGYRAWMKGHPVARVLSVVFSLLGGLAVVRLVHHPAALLAMAGVVVAPFVPELRRWWYRRSYAGLLQSLVDDLGRIQDGIDSGAKAPLDRDPALDPALDPSAGPPGERPRRTPEKEPPS